MSAQRRTGTAAGTATATATAARTGCGESTGQSSGLWDGLGRALPVVLTLTVLAVLGPVGPWSRAAQAATIKVATLAPEGSTWWNVLKDAGRQIEARTQGRVKARIYAGGVAGDEPDMVRKLRVGQLHAAAITSVGLSELQPALLALQAPGLFASWDELDAVRLRLSDRLAGLLAEKGFVVMTWGDVGFARVFSRVPIAQPTDLKQTKPWAWTQDGVYRAFYTAAGVQSVPLGVPDVLPGLQTGLIDTFSTAPLVTLSLQWFSRMEYMMDLPLSATIGAVVLSKRFLKNLSPADRATLVAVGKEVENSLAAKVRQDNRDAVEALKKAGIQVTKLTPQQRQAWRELSDAAADAAAGTAYPKDLLAEIRATVKQLRLAKSQ